MGTYLCQLCGSYDEWGPIYVSYVEVMRSGDLFMSVICGSYDEWGPIYVSYVEVMMSGDLFMSVMWKL